MAKNDERGKDRGELRRRAEERIQAAPDAPVPGAEALAPDMQRHLHELQVHQIELELQNEELQRARTEAEELLARYTDLYDHAPIGYLTLGPDAEILQVNETGAKLLEHERLQLVGRRLGILIAPPSRAALNTFLAALFAGRGAQVCEVEVPREGEGLRVLELSGTRPGHGSECRVVAADVSERRQMQAVLAQTERLTTMGIMAASVAHEIANPLTYLLYNVESLSEELPVVFAAVTRCREALRERVGDAAYAGILGEGARLLHEGSLSELVGLVREAVEGSHRIREVTRGLGTFARVEHAEDAGIDLGRSLAAAIGIARNDIRVRAKLIEELGAVPPVVATEGKLVQIFLNLLLNACHFLKEGDAEHQRIAVRTWAEGASVFVEITDTGAGIAPENIPRIFDPFFTTKGVGGGSGLGLTICRNLLRDIGGDIKVESDLGKGTRFRVRLRAAPAAISEASVPPPPVAVAERRTRGRILFVDDDETIRSLMERLLRRQHEVVVAGSGRAARNILEHDRAFDVILCDLMMPDMTGADLHEWLLGHDPALAAKVVFLTGGAFTPRVAEYIASVANIRLEKPFDWATLEILLNDLVATSRAKS